MPTLEGGKPMPPSPNGRQNFRRFWWTLFLIMGITFLFLYRWGPAPLEGMPVRASYGEFFQWLLTNQVEHKIQSAYLVENVVHGELSDGRRFLVNIPDQDPDLIRLLREQVPNFRVEPPRTAFWLNFFFNLLGPFFLLAIFWILIYRGAQGGGRLLSFGKSRAKQVTPEEGGRVTFQDVAGVDEAKEELQEVIEFLKDPRKFQRLGGKIPKGVLLLGPPGCGKTLLARAVAGQAEVPFFSISGSDFV